MKKLAVLALLLPLAVGCSKSKPEKACHHLMDLATEELEKEIAKIEKLDGGELSKKMAGELREQAKASSSSDIDICVRKMEEMNVDTSCVLDADSIDEATSCLRKR